VLKELSGLTDIEWCNHATRRNRMDEDKPEGSECSVPVVSIELGVGLARTSRYLMIPDLPKDLTINLKFI
jgi:hypothetical protein